jgi:hypothetical protein
MRLRGAAIAMLLSGALLAAALWPTPPAAIARERSAPAANLLVYAQEWSMYGSRAFVPAGRIDVQLWNRGQDAHDVRVRRVRHGQMTGPVLAGLPVTQSGAISSGVWRLAAGRYELYCSLPGHLAMGMHFRLTVTPAKRRR